MTNTITRLDPAGKADMRRPAAFQPSTFDETDNSVEVIWTTGAAVTRFDWYDGEYYDETLDTDPKSVRIDRLNSVGPLLAAHDSRNLTSVLGSVVQGSVRLSGGKGYARIRFADTPDAADALAKVKSGHLRAVSVAYTVFAYEIREPGQGKRKEMRAIDWEPSEISLVSVPADAGAIIRSRSKNMPEVHEIEDELDEPTLRQRSRGTVSVDFIRQLCSRSDDLSRAFERDLIARHEEEPMRRDDVIRAINEEYVRVRHIPPIDAANHRIGSNRPDDRDTQQRTLFAEALYARLSGQPVADRAREYAGASIVDFARAMLEERGERVRWMRAGQVIDQVFKHARSGAHTISDFPLLLQEAAGRYLVDTFNAAGSPLKIIGKKRNFADFKARMAIKANGPAVLRHVPENAEFKRVTFSESGQSMKLAPYGEIFSITRQALINDDLGVFTDMAQFWVRAQAETEAGFFAAIINGLGVVMSDGKTLYHSDHGNIAGAAAAISVASLSAARLQMRSIKNDDGVTPANVVPKYLVVGPAKETEAEQVLASINAQQPSEVNPFSGKLQLIVDSRLLGNSWRLFADPALSTVIEYGALEGQEGLFTDTRVGFEVDAVDFKARIDLGVGAVDYKGTLLNQGN